ncbi:MAG: hypothetical protein AUK54_01900 [Helicobacteraceae bacterium CG2_30_36_10]|nr:MAG: hypothetical protein AUK54_01900 [Helicobacteraceae bacterium CG2_30_36_10]
MSFSFTKENVAVIIRSIISQHLSEQNSSYFPLWFEYNQRGDLDNMPFWLDSLGLVTLATEIGTFFGVEHSGLEDNFIRYRDFQSWNDIVFDSLKHSDATITFFTSGTTGKSKQVKHPLKNIIKEATFLSTLFSGQTSIASFVRPHHIYGFIYTIVLPQILEVPVIYHEPLPSRAFFKTAPYSLLVSTPTLYRELALFEEQFSLNTIATSSTESLCKTTYELLKNKGLKEIYEIYGSSESLGVGYRTSLEAPFKLFDYLQKDFLLDIQDGMDFKEERLFTIQNRNDSLLKYRGYKLNLAEYETKLKLLEGIDEANASVSKGKLLCFICSKNKPEVLKQIALHLSPTPDKIIWLEV